MTDSEEILERYRALCRAFNEASPLPGGVTVLPVTKTVPAERILCLKDAGVSAIGENRVQEAMEKREALNGAFETHIIGRTQTNKAKFVLRFAKMVQSLDRLELARALSREAVRAGRTLDVLIEVNIGSDPAKAGVSEEDAPDFARECEKTEGLNVMGLMTVTPIVLNPEDARPYFRRMRALFERLRDERPENMRILSMGMSHDGLIAAQEGATMVRIGSGIFGQRTYPAEGAR